MNRFKNFCFMRKLDDKDPKSAETYKQHRELTEAAELNKMFTKLNK